MQYVDTYGWPGLLRDIAFVGGSCLFVSALPVQFLWWHWCGLACSLLLLKTWMNNLLDNVRVIAQEAMDQQQIRHERIAEMRRNTSEF